MTSGNHIPEQGFETNAYRRALAWWAEDADRAAGCDGKHGYDTWRQAHAVVKKSRNAHQVYRCPFCGKFHVAG